MGDALEREFGRDLLFMDVDAVPLGINFVKVLSEEVAKCDVLHSASVARAIVAAIADEDLLELFKPYHGFWRQSIITDSWRRMQ